MRLQNTQIPPAPAGLSPTIATVVSASGHEIVLRGSNLTPSRPGCQGDLGTVEGIDVLHVDEVRGGTAHLLEHPMACSPGQLVEVVVDADRRDRLARTHTACVLARSLLKWKQVGVNSVEIDAGVGWLDLDRPAPFIDLAKAALREVSLTARPRQGGRVLVEGTGIEIETFDAPILRNSIGVFRARVEPAEPLEGSVAAIEISFPRWPHALMEVDRSAS